MTRRGANPRPTRRSRRGTDTSAASAPDDSVSLSVNTATFASSGPLARLPFDRVGETVVSFVASPPELVVRRHAGLDFDLFQRQLTPLRLVCQRWNQLVNSLVATFSSLLCVVAFTTGSRQQTEQICQRLAETGDAAVQLVIQAQYPKPQSRLMIPRPASKTDLLGRISWAPVLKLFSSVLRLDLFNACLSLVAKVLEAASTHCPRVEVLVLPHQRSNTARLVTHADVTSHLVTALGAWHASNGGLRGLIVPMWPSEPRGEYDDVLGAVAAHCPRLEFLHGWHKDTMYGMASVVQLADVREGVWASFCESCTQLTEFSWRLAPFTAPVLTRFGSTQRPRLTSLCLDDSFAGRETTAAADLGTIQLMLPALPALLSLELWMPLYGKQRGSTVNQKRGSLDALAQSLLDHCPRLESFRCSLPRSLSVDSMLTDGGLATLSRCPRLGTVVVTPLRLEGNGLVEMVMNLLSVARKARHVELFVTGSAHVAGLSLLRYLETADPSLFRGVHLHVAVEVPDGDTADQVKGLATAELIATEALTTLVQAVRVRHSETFTHLAVGTNHDKGAQVVSEISIGINASSELSPLC